MKEKNEEEQLRETAACCLFWPVYGAVKIRLSLTFPTAKVVWGGDFNTGMDESLDGSG